MCVKNFVYLSPEAGTHMPGRGNLVDDSRARAVDRESLWQRSRLPPGRVMRQSEEGGGRARFRRASSGWPTIHPNRFDWRVRFAVVIACAPASERAKFLSKPSFRFDALSVFEWWGCCLGQKGTLSPTAWIAQTILCGTRARKFYLHNDSLK